MSEQHKKHSGKHNHGHEHSSKPKGGGQSRWFIAAVVLMLIGMAIYWATMDEELGPRGGNGEQVPADAPAE